MEKGFIENDKETKRVVFIDIAKGMAILLMIVGHVIKYGLLRRIIFSFHMPLFIIISGLCYKEKSIKEEIKNSITKLLIPTFAVIFLLFIINGLHNEGIVNIFIEYIKEISAGISHVSKIKYNIAGTDVLWFIYLLVGIRIIFRINKKIAKDNEICLLTIIILETYIGYILGLEGYWLPWSLDITFVSIVFYYVGYILKKYNLHEEILSNNKILILIFIIWILGIKYNWIELAIRRYPHGCFSLITAISGSLIVLKISKIIEKRFHMCSKILAFCGEHSLYILFGHRIAINFINYKLPNKGLLDYRVLAFFNFFFSMLFALIILCIREIKKKLKKIRVQRK